MIENNVKNDKQKEKADAIEILLARVPSMPEHLPGASQWVESVQRKPNPHGIF